MQKLDIVDPGGGAVLSGPGQKGGGDVHSKGSAGGGDPARQLDRRLACPTTQVYDVMAGLRAQAPHGHAPGRSDQLLVVLLCRHPR
jgi:hypothetical protein